MQGLKVFPCLETDNVTVSRPRDSRAATYLAGCLTSFRKSLNRLVNRGERVLNRDGCFRGQFATCRTSAPGPKAAIALYPLRIVGGDRWSILYRSISGWQQRGPGPDRRLSGLNLRKQAFVGSEINEVHLARER